MEEKHYHMTPGQFREEGKKLIDWIASYYENIETYPVLSQVRPGEISRQLPGKPPFSGEDFGKMMDDIDRIIMPGITHWQSPSFFAFFPAKISVTELVKTKVESKL